MTRTEWIKHALVFVAAIFLVWLSGVVPVLVNDPEAFATMATPTLSGLLAAWPIYIAVAICQALTFHYVKTWPALFFLVGVFVLGLLFAWRYWTPAVG